MKLVNFDFDKDNISVFIDNNGNPWFSAQSVCKVLNHSNASQAIKNNCEKEGISTAYTLTNSGRQSIIIINESNLYRLIFKSRLENAKKFQSWVFEKVLPSIRKTGKYSIPEEVKKMSVKHRSALTAEWSAKGVKQNEYKILTIEEYRQLFNNTDIRKKQMNKKEILTLSAFEALESLKLYNNPEIGGFADCKISITETASTIKKITGGEK